MTRDDLIHMAKTYNVDISIETVPNTHPEINITVRGSSKDTKKFMKAVRSELPMYLKVSFIYHTMCCRIINRIRRHTS